MARKGRRRGQKRPSHHNVIDPRRPGTSLGNAGSDKPDEAAQVAAVKANLEQALGARAIEFVSIGQLRLDPRNSRRHSDGQIAQLMASIGAFGIIKPVIIDEADRVLAGHGCLEAAKRLNIAEVPCVRIEHLSSAAKRAYALADNRLAELSDWDEDQLAAELEDLSSLDLDFDLEVTGFDTVDLDRLLGPEPDPGGREGDIQGLSKDPDDDIPALQAPPVSRLGDIWQLGAHLVACADALDDAVYPRLLGEEMATQCVSDPPYNVRISGHVTSKSGFREFPMASGEMSVPAFTEFLTRFLVNVARHSRDGTILHVFMDWRHLEQLLQAARGAGLTLMNMCAWCKPQAGMGSFYRSQHELVVVLKSGKAAHINTFGLGARGRSRSNVWRYPSVRGPRRGVNAPERGGHPTPKPVSLLIDAIRDCSHRGDIILDAFGGSGATLIAAERSGRRARMIELDPAYVDLTVRRWQALFGRPPTLAGDGRTFDEIAAARHVEHDRVPEVVPDGGGNGQEV